MNEHIDRLTGHRLLTATEEIQLARKIKAGGIEGQRAKDKLVEHNLRLVGQMASGFRNRGVEHEDLFQAGVVGLVKAASKYDPSRGFRFSTYASWWVRQALQRAVAAAETIRLPDAVKKARLTAFNNPELTDAEVAVKNKVTERTVRAARNAATVTASLDFNRNRNDDEVPVADVEADGELDRLVSRESSGWIRELVADLPADERAVLELRFALTGGDELSLDQIAALLKLELARVRQLNNAAIHHLRQATRSVA